MLRRSEGGLAWFEADEESLTADVPLESQENGIESFFAGGGVGEGFEVIDFELWDREGNLGGGPRAFGSLPFDVIVAACGLASVDSSSSWTSSREDVDSRRAVSKGDFEPTTSDVESLVSLSITAVRSTFSRRFGSRGVDDRAGD